MKTNLFNHISLLCFSITILCIYLRPSETSAQQSVISYSGNTSHQSTDFIMHPVDLNIPGIHCIKIFDLDQDGDFDIIGGSEHTPYSSSVGLIWWRNEGGYPAEWTKITIDDSFLHVMSIDAAFINDDELPDIVATSWENGKISWWQNSGNPETNWLSYDIVTDRIYPHDAVCFDIDGDLKNDVIGVSAGDNIISVFYNQGGTVPGWQENIVTSDFIGAKTVMVEDLNNDSLPDLISAGDGCDDIAWWKNVGGTPINWVKQYVTTNFNGSIGLDADDMNYDNQLDIIGTGWAGNELSFWLCNDIVNNTWEKTTVTNQLEIAVKGIGSDIDMDGDKDIVAVGKVPGELAVFFKEEDIFIKEVLYPDFNGGSALAVFDIDQDGDDDIISGAGILKHLYLFENTTNTTLAPDARSITSELRIFPNPSKGKCIVTIPDLNESTVYMLMFDTKGNLVFRKKLQVENYQICLFYQGLKQGIYLIEIHTGEHTYRGELISL